MEGGDLPRSLDHQASFERTSFTPSQSFSNNTQSLFALQQNYSNESLPNFSSEELQPSPVISRSPSHPLPYSRSVSPAMESRPARKTTAPGALDLDIPVTYTPTTHRVSKAKKGKKVHVCEFGCGKVFTRAEHRKRHEANHSREPLFKCHVEGCHKPFQRQDLLSRHLERQHGLPVAIDGRRRRASSATSSVGGSSATGSPAPTLGALSQQSSSPALFGFSNPNTPSLISGNIMDPRRARAYSQPGSSWSQFSMPLPETTRSFTPDYVSDAPTAEPESMYGQSGFYTSDMRHSSPNVGHGYNTSYQKPTNQFATDYTPMAMTNPYGAYPQAGEGLGLDLGGGQYTAHVGLGSASIVDVESVIATHAPPNYSSQLSSGDLVGFDDEMKSHYEICYWETVDPIFPIIHYHTYVNETSQSGLSNVVCALGAQASPRAPARKHSVALFDMAMTQYQMIEPLNALQSPVGLLQLTFLVEYLALYRSRSAGVYRSTLFAALFNDLLSNLHNLQNRPGFYASSPTGEADGYLHESYRQWVDLETRRRLLAACLILDTHRERLFEQRPSAPGAASAVANSFTPCSPTLWTTTNLRQWHKTLCEPFDPSHSTPFHSSLTHTLSLQTDGTISPQFSPDLLACALQLATHACVRQLLITAARSWLFTRKVSEPSWQTAKSELRSWASSQDATIAAWLAGKVLRMYFASMPAPSSAGQQTTTPRTPSVSHPPNLQSRPGIIRLETHWCLYLAALVLWAYTQPAAQQSVLSPPLSAPYSQTQAPAPMSIVGGVPRRAQTHPLAQMTPLSPPPNILPSQPDPDQQQVAPRVVLQRQQQQQPPQSQAPVQQPPAPARRRQQKLAAQRGGPSPLMQFLARLDTPTWPEVVAVRGAGGVQPVLAAVKGVLREGDGFGQRVVLEMGALVGEAVGVLGRLEGGRGGGF